MYPRYKGYKHLKAFELCPVSLYSLIPEYLNLFLTDLCYRYNY